MKTKMPLDIYDDMPKDMKRYISAFGWNFNKKAYEFAAKSMKKRNPATGKNEQVEPYTKEQVDELLVKHGIQLENNVLYNYVYVATMGKADFLKSSIPDEQHLALYIKDVIDDIDASPETTFRRWTATMVGNGEPIEWSDFM